MTVSVELNKNRYTANGSLKTFAYTFKIFEDSDLTVILTDTNGVEDTQTLTTHYTVTGAGNENGGNVVFLTAPTNNYTVTLWGTYDFLQETEFEEGDSMPAETLESTFDKQTMTQIYLKEIVDRCIKTPVSEGSTDMELPPLADRVNKYAGFDENGDLVATQFSSEATTYMDTMVSTVDNQQELKEYVGVDDGSGNFTISGTLYANTIHLTEDVITIDDVIIGDDLTVSGSTTVKEDLTVEGIIYANDIQSTDDLTVGDDLHVEGSMYVLETATITGSLNAEGGAAVTGNLTVSNNATITNDILGKHDLILSRHATITGTLGVQANTGSTVFDISGSNVIVGPSAESHIDVDYLNEEITVYSGTTALANFTETEITLFADTTISGALGFSDIGTTVNEFSTDGTMAGNSDDAVPTEQAVVEYVSTVSGSLQSQLNGYAVTASGYASDAEGYATTASGYADDADASATTASGHADDAYTYLTMISGVANAEHLVFDNLQATITETYTFTDGLVLPTSPPSSGTQNGAIWLS